MQPILSRFSNRMAICRRITNLSFITTLFFILTGLIIDFGQVDCEDDVCYSPSATRPSPSEFTGRSSMAQVMVGSPIQCTGRLTHWSFISTNSYASGVTFFVWRPFPQKAGSAYFTSIGTYELAGERFFQPYAWITISASPPINVQEGDVIGVYYDDWRLDDYFAFIPISAPTRMLRRGSNLTLVDTLVSAKSRVELAFEGFSLGVIDMSDASKVRRQIALQAHVEPLNGRALNKLRNGVCQLPYDAGDCLGLIPSFYYDAIFSDCRPFIYGGCGGNGNRFLTAEECSATCHQPNAIINQNNNVNAFRGQLGTLRTLLPTKAPFTPRQTPRTATTPQPTPASVMTPRKPLMTRSPWITRLTTRQPFVFIGLSPIEPNKLPSPTRCIDLFQTKQNCDRRVIQTKYFFNVAKNLCEPFFHFINCVTSANIYDTKEECDFNCQVLARDPTLLSKFRDPFHPVAGSSPRYNYEK